MEFGRTVSGGAKAVRPHMIHRLVGIREGVAVRHRRGGIEHDLHDLLNGTDCRFSCGDITGVNVLDQRRVFFGAPLPPLDPAFRFQE